MTLPTLNFAAILPEIILLVAATAVLLLDLALRDKRALGWFSLASVAIALVAVVVVNPGDGAFQTMALADGMGRFLSATILVAAGMALLLSVDRAGDFTIRLGAYYALVLLATTGMCVMAIASDLMTIFLGLEILSLALYILVGFNRQEAHSSEAALKYFLLGAFASGFLLYGIALIYGAYGTTNLAGIARYIAPLSVTLPGVPLLPIGMGLLLVGFGFKLALVPFHMWTPDVYQGAPTEITAFMSVATKTAAFGALIRILGSVMTHDRPWLLVLAILAVLTMTLGNLAALRQASLKRMLAYSSIAHAGYVLTALAAGNGQGVQGAMYYLLAYTFMNIGAFAVILAVQGRDEDDVTMDRMTGLAGRAPGLAGLMSLFMFSLIGVPPLAGFFGKLYAFSAAVQGGLAWLAVIAMINSAVAAYYYLRVTVSMYMALPSPEPAIGGVPTPVTTSAMRRPRPATTGPASTVVLAAPVATIVSGQTSIGTKVAGNPVAGKIPPTTWPVWATLVVAGLGTVVLGIWQAPVMQTITQAAAALAFR